MKNDTVVAGLLAQIIEAAKDGQGNRLLWANSQLKVIQQLAERAARRANKPDKE